MRNYNLLFLLAVTLVVAFVLPQAYEAYATSRGEYISAQAMSQRALFRYLERVREQDNNRAMTSGELSPVTHIQIKEDVHYLLDGKFYKLAKSDTPTFAPTVTTVLAVSKARLYVLGAGANATASLYVSADVAAADVAKIVTPTMPDGIIPFGSVLVVTNATDSFIYGTTAFASASAITTTNFSYINPFGDENYQDL